MVPADGIVRKLAFGDELGISPHNLLLFSHRMSKHLFVVVASKSENIYFDLMGRIFQGLENDICNIKLKPLILGFLAISRFQP